MKSVDFSSELTPDGRIAVPPEIASRVPQGEKVQVVLTWGAVDDDAAWREAGLRRFEAAYAVDDSVYESLIHDSSTR